MHRMENPVMHQDVTRGEYVISTDPARLDLAVIHRFLGTSYWAEGIPMEIVRRSVENSLNFGIYHCGQQVGFARVVTDKATFAYLGDVFILEEHRAKQLATWLMETIIAHPELQDLRRFLLATRDAEKLYEKVGFKPLAHPERFREIHTPGLYLTSRLKSENGDQTRRA
jgi:GNAT superfamily N-acetyltransferase